MSYKDFEKLGIDMKKRVFAIGISKNLKDKVEKTGFADIGEGVAEMLMVSESVLSEAISILENEGYVRQRVKLCSVRNTNEYVFTDILVGPGKTSYTIIGK